VSPADPANASAALNARNAQVIAATRAWLEKAVIGLNLCPFARNPHVHGRIRFVVSEQLSTVGLLIDLAFELQRLHQIDPLECETTLLIHPQVLADFHLYNDFLDESDALVETLALTGELQIASFHPDYQFAHTEPQDMENYSNRSPYPMLHLLREASVSLAADSHVDVDGIIDCNKQTLRKLGIEGWRSLWSTESH
jgi:hypothetical protein